MINIIERAQGRNPKVDHLEKHHIIPRSMGGLKGPIALLTPREHFIVHWLLTKCVSEPAHITKMNYALSRMRAGKKLTSMEYRIGREAIIKANKNRVFSEETRLNMRNAALGRKVSEETKLKISLARRGKPGPPRSKEVIEKHRQAILGRKHSEETKLKRSISLKGKKKHSNFSEVMKASWVKRREFYGSTGRTDGI